MYLSYLDIADSHTEEQVHDDNGDDDDEDGEDHVGGEGKVLGQVVLLQVPGEVLLRPRSLVQHNLLALGVVEVVVLNLARHHHHDLQSISGDIDEVSK